MHGGEEFFILTVVWILFRGSRRGSGYSRDYDFIKDESTERKMPPNANTRGLVCYLYLANGKIKYS